PITPPLARVATLFPYTTLFRSQTLAGVIGMSTWRTPRCQSASTTALAMAAGAPTVADSPTPLAPSGWCGEGVHVLSVSHFGVSTDRKSTRLNSSHVSISYAVFC